MPSKIKKSEYELFNNLSQEWWDENGKFRVLHQIRPLRIQYILDQLQDRNFKTLNILDVGCGGGLVSESLSKLGAKVTGVDFIKKNIEIAKNHAIKKNIKVDYLHANIEKMNLRKKYDVIIMFEILEHLDDWRNFLLNINKNLNKNGTIIISTINRNLISKMFAIYFAENILNWIPKGTHSYKKLIKPNEIYSFMKSNNFKFKNIKGLVFNPFEFNWKISKNTNINYFCSYIKTS